MDETGFVLHIPIDAMTDIERIDDYYWRVRFVGKEGYVINSPQFEAEFERLEKLERVQPE